MVASFTRRHRSLVAAGGLLLIIVLLPTFILVSDWWIAREFQTVNGKLIEVRFDNHAKLEGLFEFSANDKQWAWIEILEAERNGLGRPVKFVRMKEETQFRCHLDKTGERKTCRLPNVFGW